MVVVALLAYGLGTQSPDVPTFAQEKGAAAAKAEAPKARKKPRGRLPIYFGQVGLSEEQRTKIYGIQAEYGKQLDDLRKQVAAIEAKRDGEVEAVLTDAQKKKLGELRVAAKKAAEARRTKKKSS